ncbi:MAG: FAD-dependent oxidoreductase [Clostridia bacterium]|nr:FAD-dependent oxidoreductase [Clostridia bacterium]NCC68438.1 FAD-dependent oxidoreductase [Clostridia bacterium]
MKKIKNLLILALAVALVLGLAACGGNPSSTAAPTEAPTAEPSGKTSMNPGTYTATTAGVNGDVTVEVVVTEDAIESVVVTDCLDTTGIGTALKDSDGNILTAGGEAPTELIPREIVSSQSVNIDSVAGATLTSVAIRNAVSDCLTQAGADLSQWKDATEPSAAPSNDSADVVVVGAGGSGLAAAISANQNGASVIVIEKNGEVGGNTLVCGGIYNCPDEALQSKVTMTDSVKATIEKALAEEPVSEEHAALQAEVKAQWDEYAASGRTDLFDSKEWFALQTWINGDKVGDLDLVKKLTYDAYEGYEWILSLGTTFIDEIGQGAGSLWQRTHTSTMKMGTGLISHYTQIIGESSDIKLYTDTTAEHLVQDDSGRVCGVICTDKNGNEFTVSASKGVVLATGGFSANSEMVSEYNTSGKWNDLSNVPTTNRTTVSQGDGINLALEVGASLTDMNQLQLLYLGNCQDAGLTKYPTRVLSGTDQEIFVNINGERFVREDGRRDQICLAVLDQPEQMFYFIESADGDYTDVNTAISADGFTFQYLEEKGFIIIADTLAELAEKLGMDPDVLQNTVDEFNACVEAGVDEEFGRTLFSIKLENGPWVATPRQACVHHTMGGVTIDAECHVLDESGNIIPGLVAAGEITGGVHGANRLGGNAVVDTVVFGKQAGETIATD